MHPGPCLPVPSPVPGDLGPASKSRSPYFACFHTESPIGEPCGLAEVVKVGSHRHSRVRIWLCPTCRVNPDFQETGALPFPRQCCIALQGNGPRCV